MNDHLQTLWTYFAGIMVWCLDHWSGFAALTLFILQAVYQIYRIRIVKRLCEEEENGDDTKG